MAVSATNSHVLYREIYNHDQQKQQPSSSGRSCTVSVNGVGLYNSMGFWSDCMKRERTVSRREIKTEAFWDQVAKPTSIELESISDVEQLDQILLEAQEISHPVVIDWMANWCRKCIYLKPKVEKLAAEYNGRVKFYYVDVNNVSKALVKRGNISKMPTIQLWKNGEMKEEVIGGHKAWLVIDEIREMIQKHLYLID